MKKINENLPKLDKSFTKMMKIWEIEQKWQQNDEKEVKIDF